MRGKDYRSMAKQIKYHSIDLFAGIGGIRLGFEQAFGKQIDTVFVSEFNKNQRLSPFATTLF